jgi:cytochrome c oxidase assembly protein subunit 15
MVWFQRTSASAAVLAFIVITLGAWVRLTDAGLGCPDWPGCFGHLTVPESEQQLARVADEFGNVAVETGKAWREMIHRYVAATLGLLIVGLGVMAWRNRRDPRQPLAVPVLLVALVMFQGLLGMWTVTLLLQPIIVMGHLLGGMSILALLTWLALVTRRGVTPRPPVAGGLRALAAVVLLGTFAQIALGGWTSTNYAALACPDFPTCQNEWWPDADWSEGFVPWRGIDSSFEGGVLQHPARVAIHLAHRVGALAITGLLLFALWRVATNLGSAGRRAAAFTGAALLAQVAIGVMIVTYGLPLWLGVAHNGNAALLLLGVLGLSYVVRYQRVA